MMAESLSKERRVRARVESIYNKQETDFALRAEYDNYLEEREDIILNLSEDIDVEATEAKLRTYERANFADIAAKEARKVEDKRVRAEQLDKASSGAAESALAPSVAGPSAGLGSQAPAATAASQPAPLQPPPRPADRPNGLSAEAHARMAAASGWSADFERRRMLAEAFSSVFVA